MKSKTLKSKKMIFIFLPMLFISCVGYDSVISEYNSNFSVRIREDAFPNVNSEDFYESAMIQDEKYILTVNQDFQIYAPFGGKSYQWKIEYETDEQTEEGKETSKKTKGVDLGTDVKTNERALHVYFSQTTVELYKPYMLSLTVVNQDDKTFFDSAKLYFVPED